MKLSLFQTALSSLLLGSVLLAEVPERSYAGQTLAIPEAQLDEGFSYHTQPGEDTQLTLRVESELQHVSFQHSRIIGYILVPFEVEEETIPILAGGFRIPAQGFRASADAPFYSPSCAGRPDCMASRILAGPDYLDSESHPEITFEITRVHDVKLESRSENKSVYTLKISGPLIIKGKTKEITLASVLTLLPSTRETMSRNVGDIATLKTSLELPIEDFGWEVSRFMQALLPKALHAEIFLMLNTISPDKSLLPSEDPKRYQKYLRYFTLARDLNDPVATRAFGKEYLKEAWDNQDELHRFARTLATAGGIQHRNLHLALKVAQRANELADSKDAQVLDTVARVHYEIGDLESAVDWQKKAVALVEGESRQAKSIQATLAQYEMELGK